MKDGPRRTRLAGDGEFAIIRDILADARAAGTEIQVGPGDDGAVLEGGWVVSSDQTVEGVHYRPGWLTPEEVGGRAVRAALSDLAAMAARPVGALFSLAVPRGGGTAQARAHLLGARDALEAEGGAVLGGDLSALPEGAATVLDVTVVGRTETPLLRSGARVGQEVWCTGPLGGAAGAVHLWSIGREPGAALRGVFTTPRPRWRAVRWLRERVALGAGIDVSDGLLADAAHVAAASAVRVVLHAETVPVHPALVGHPELAPLDLALGGGEDYEVLLTVPAGGLDAWVDEARDHFDVTLTRIGRIERGAGVAIRREGGEVTGMDAPPGFDHFPTSSTDSDSGSVR